MQRLDLDLGLRPVPYRQGWDLQRAIHADVVAQRRPSMVVLVEHEEVYTVGRRARSWERPTGEFVEPGHVPVVMVDRGGKTTWHGPGQLTIYPIVRLQDPIDVIVYVRALEAAAMEVCQRYGVPTTRVEGRSGVWVTGGSPRPASGRTAHAGAAAAGAALAQGRDERKICALGVRVARGATMHGIGLNVAPDLAAFDLDRIIPCGITDAGVTSLSAETHRDLTVTDVADAAYEAIEHHLKPLVADATPQVLP